MTQNQRIFSQRSYIAIREYTDPPEEVIKPFLKDELDTIKEQFKDKLSVDIAFDGKQTIRAEHHVGYVVLANHTITIYPKVSTTNFVNMVRYALNLPQIKIENIESSKNTSFYDILVLFFLYGLDVLIKRGLFSNYFDHDENLSTVKGKILFKEHLTINYGRNDKVYCLFSELTQDILENQIIKFAIYHLMRGNFLDPNITSRLGKYLRRLDNIALVPITDESFKLVNYTPLNDHYKPTLELCKMLLQGTSLKEDRIGISKSFSYLINMEKLFEDFVREYLRQHLVEYNVEAGHNYLDTDNKAIELYPDVVISKGRQTLLILDAKYKSLNDRRIIRSDVSQILDYCLAYKIRRGILLYPQYDLEFSDEYHIKNTDKIIEVRSVGIVSDKDRFPELDRLAYYLKSIVQQ